MVASTIYNQQQQLCFKCFRLLASSLVKQLRHVYCRCMFRVNKVLLCLSSKMVEETSDIMAARERMIARRFGGANATRTGGVRRKKKNVHKTATSGQSLLENKPKFKTFCFALEGEGGQLQAGTPSQSIHVTSEIK